MSETAVIFGYVDNLMFSTRIESVVENLGFEMVWAEPSFEGAATEIDRLIPKNPALILVDLGYPHIPWAELISAIKSNPALKTIPLICYGSHKDVETLKVARQAGADQVLARSRFFSALPEFIQKNV